MSTLQVALAIAGGVVLAGVVAHSAWSSRKNNPRQADPVPGRDAEAGSQLAPPQDPQLDSSGLAGHDRMGHRTDPADLDAVVPDGPGLEMALLGMSFLTRTEMRREGENLTLTKRY